MILLGGFIKKKRCMINDITYYQRFVQQFSFFGEDYDWLSNSFSQRLCCQKNPIEVHRVIQYWCHSINKEASVEAGVVSRVRDRVGFLLIFPISVVNLVRLWLQESVSRGMLFTSNTADHQSKLFHRWHQTRACAYVCVFLKSKVCSKRIFKMVLSTWIAHM